MLNFVSQPTNSVYLGKKTVPNMVAEDSSLYTPAILSLHHETFCNWFGQLSHGGSAIVVQTLLPEYVRWSTASLLNLVGVKKRVTTHHINLFMTFLFGVIQNILRFRQFIKEISWTLIKQ